MKLLKLVPDNTNIKFLKWSLPFFLGSALLIAASLGLVVTKGLNLGIDFVGGQQVQVTFPDLEQAPIPELREDLTALGYGNPVVQRFGEDNAVSIRMRLPPDMVDDAQASSRMTGEVRTTIEQEYPTAIIGEDNSVSGKVSEELFSNAMYALLAAILAISIYIWIRFEWQFGVGATLALVHDVVLTLGMFALFQFEFDLKIIAAILTIIGYSLNDTIVVYDRIRENLKKFRKMPLSELLDLSVNETLARTVMTSLTLIVVLIALMILGPQSLFHFTAAITLGIVVGTYSSVYMAAPMLLWMKVTSTSFVPEESVAERQERIAKGEL